MSLILFVSIVSQLLPAAFDRYLAALPAISLIPIRSIVSQLLPAAFDRYLAALPAISLIPIRSIQLFRNER